MKQTARFFQDSRFKLTNIRYVASAAAAAAAAAAAGPRLWQFWGHLLPISSTIANYVSLISVNHECVQSWA